MAKTKMTAREIAERIRERLEDRNLRVGVFFDKIKGWHAIAYSSPETVSEKQKRVDRVADEFRDCFDLKED
jgi:hypothetical protein